MQPHPTALAAAVLLACAQGAAMAAPAALESLGLMDQAGTLPDGFREHFFDLPLVVRVERDGQYLGDARVLLSQANTVQLIDFVEHADSVLGESERQRWMQQLGEPRPLGVCAARCDDGLLGLHYSLESSLLSIRSRDGERDGQPVRHLQLPQGGSRGLALRHQLNLYGGQAIGTAGRYAADLEGSLGQWTAVASYQLDRSGEQGGDVRHAMQRAYLQREYNDHFLRAGWFLPSFEGVTRQPRAPGATSYSTLGLMAGSSDSLRAEAGTRSLYPIYVSADREGTVEVYRDGSLILVQPVQAGLQELDSSRLPGGIYEVELRVMQDGQLRSREMQLVHKPNHWRDSDRRWRYSAYLGRQHALFDSFADPQRGELAAGAILNVLAHPRAVLGASLQTVGNERAAGASLDWHAADRLNLYLNGYRSNTRGRGLDAQALWRYRSGSVIASHSRSSVQRDDVDDAWQPRHGTGAALGSSLRSSALSINHRIGDRAHLSARVSQQQGAGRGTGLDLSFNRRQTLFGSDATWRASLFDRPGTASTGFRRNRGVDFSLNLALGSDARRYHGNLGSRAARDGRRELHGSVGVQQQFDQRLLQSLGAQLNADRDGIGMSGTATFQHPALRGDAFAQRSSVAGGFSGGLNLDSALAIGDGRLAIVGDARGQGVGTGVIIDIDSELDDVALTAHDSRGGSHPLRPGRNFVQVPAYRAGHLQLDFAGGSVPAASLQPAMVGYHLNKGGVDYQQVRVLRTITVIGHLQDRDGQPLGGAQVLNHAGRSVSEADGFFTLEMSARQPSLQVKHPKVGECQFLLDDRPGPASAPTWMAGALRCPGTVSTAAELNMDAARERLP